MAEGAQRTWRDSAATHIPNAWHLTRDNRGWNSTFLFPAPELSPPKGIIMELESWDNDTVAVNITNSSGEEWTYGEHFALQVLLDNTWYQIPPERTADWGFTDVALIIPDGETQARKYSIAPYGSLPEGTYRLVLPEGLHVEGGIDIL